MQEGVQSGKSAFREPFTLDLKESSGDRVVHATAGQEAGVTVSCIRGLAMLVRARRNLLAQKLQGSYL